MFLSNLVRAIKYGNLNDFRKFIQYVDPSSEYEGKTLLMHAAIHGRLAIVRMLKHRVRSLYKRDADGYDAFHHAVIKGHYDVSRFFMQYMDQTTSKSGYNQLSLAVYYNHADLVQLLYDDRLVYIGQALSVAIEAKNKEMVRFLAIKNKYYQEKYKKFALIKDLSDKDIAIICDDVDAVRISLALTYFKTESSLILKLPVDEIDSILSKILKEDEGLINDFKFALSLRSYFVITYFIDVFKVSPDTILSINTTSNSIENGEDTPLCMAVRENDNTLVALLMLKGAKIDAPGPRINPICIAASHGHIDILRSLLIRYKTHINDKCYLGTTALMHAVFRQKKDAAKMLLTYGADPFLKTDDGLNIFNIIETLNLDDEYLYSNFTLEIQE